MANNTLSLIFEISANPAQAQAALEKVKAAGIDASTSLQTTLDRISTSSVQATQRMGAFLTGTEQQAKRAASAIRSTGAEVEASAVAGGTAAKDVAAQLNGIEAAAAGATGGVRQALGSLRMLRIAEYSTLGLISVGFYISEWAKVTQAIQQATVAMGGFSKAQQTVFEQQVKFNQSLIFSTKGNLESELHKAQASAAKIREQLAAAQEAEAKATKNSQGAIAGYTEGIDQAHLKVRQLTEALQQNDVWRQKLTLGIAKFQEQDARAAERKKEHAKITEKLAAAQLRAGNAFATARAHLPPLISQIEELGQKSTQAADPFLRIARTAQALAEIAAAKKVKYVPPSLEALGIRSPRLVRPAGGNILPPGLIPPNGGLTLQQIVAGHYMVEEKTLERNQRLAEEIARRHGRVIQEFQKAIRAHGYFAGENLSPLGQSFAQFNQHLQKAGQMAAMAVAPFTQLGFRVAQIKQAVDMSGLSLEKISAAMGKNVAMAIVYGDNIGRAMEKAAKATLTSIAAQAFVQAIYSTALGFLRLAEFQFGAAAQAFTSAAILGMVGGAVSAIGHAIPGGTGGRGASAGASRGTVPGHGLSGSPGLVGSEGRLGGGGSAVRHQTIVNINGGAITDTHNLQNLITAINQGGHFGTVRLNVKGTSSMIPEPSY